MNVYIIDGSSVTIAVLIQAELCMVIWYVSL